MLIRIVKLTFNAHDIEDFLAFMAPRQERIRNFKGCTYLDLLQDINNPNIVFSYSYWEDQAALDNYRYSPFFRETWNYTKARFSAAPEAWSTQKLP
jgi:quinol monooxygenase YgiN